MSGKDLPSDTTTISTLSVEQADRLARREGDLDLDGLITLSLEVATALAKHEGSLSLNGLTSLSDKAADALAKHKDDLSLDGLTTLSPEAAEALAKHKGGLSLKALRPVLSSARDADARWPSFNVWWEQVGEPKASKMVEEHCREHEPNDPDDSAGGDSWHVNDLMHSGEAVEQIAERAGGLFKKGRAGEFWEMTTSDTSYCELDEVLEEAYEAGKARKDGTIGTDCEDDCEDEDGEEDQEGDDEGDDDSVNVSEPPNKSQEIRKAATLLAAEGGHPLPEAIIASLSTRSIEVSLDQVMLVLRRMGMAPPDDSEAADGEEDQEVISSVADLINALSRMEKTSMIRIRVEVDGEVSGYMNIDKVEVVDDGVEISTCD